jgi:hypothetical protein
MFRMPTFRQLLIGVLMLGIAIAMVAGLAVRNAAQPLRQADEESVAAQILSVDMGLSAELPGPQLR